MAAQDTRETTPVHRPSASSSPAVGSAESEGEPTKEYILLDTFFYKVVNGKSKKYKQGRRVPLTDDEARTLLAEPRPSVRVITKEDNKKDEDEKEA